jgi:hypothetical protein
MCSSRLSVSGGQAPFAAGFSVCPHDSIQEPLDKIWHANHASADRPKIVFLAYVQPVLLTWKMKELLRWERKQHTTFTAKTI